jgi:prepilin-type N-terminal cleavage/methylation domain-containing protein
MNLKSNRGYSLIEIAIGLAVMTIFLACTGSLINASFTNYRLLLQRNEALDFAIKEMENVLQSEDTTVSDIGFSENSMNARVKIENVKNGNKVYDDKVFLVTVNVEYKRTANSTEKYNVELKSLKIVK